MQGGDYLAYALKRGRGRPRHDTVTIGGGPEPGYVYLSDPFCYMASLRHARVGEPLILGFENGAAFSIILGPHGHEIRELHKPRKGAGEILYSGGKGSPSKPASVAFVTGPMEWAMVGGTFIAATRTPPSG